MSRHFLLFISFIASSTPGDLFLNAASPSADAPSTTTTSASNVNGGNATLGGSVNPNGDQTQIWFEYGLTNSYGSDTRSRSSDDAESYSTWAYGSNGGSGFGAATYREGTGGGIVLVTGSTRIDGAKSFDVFAGGGAGNTQALDRQFSMLGEPAHSACPSAGM